MDHQNRIKICFNHNNHSEQYQSIADLPGEQWKPIPGFTDLYEISSFGRIKSSPRQRNSAYGRSYISKEKIRILALICSPNTKVGDVTSVLVVCLSAHGKTFSFGVGRMEIIKAATINFRVTASVYYGQMLRLYC